MFCGYCIGQDEPLQGSLYILQHIRQHIHISPAAVQHMLQSSKRIINTSSYKLLRVNDIVSSYLKLISLDIVGRLKGLADK